MLFSTLIRVITKNASILVTPTIPLLLTVVGHSIFSLRQGTLPEPSIWNYHIIKLLFGTIILIFIKIFSITVTLRIPLLLLNVGVVRIQFFIFSSSEEQHKLPEPSFQNKNAMKMLFSTLVIVVMKTFFEAVKLTTPVFLALIGMYMFCISRQPT